MTGRRPVIHDGQTDILDYLDQIDDTGDDAETEEKQ